jgi:LmbE family N-acetylglucosaminyl deacetylase
LLNVNFMKERSSGLRILCLGAHSDDLEIGCGGTILNLTERHRDTDILWVVFGTQGRREREASESARYLLKRAKKKRIIIKSFRDGFFPYLGPSIKNYFERLKKEFSPDLIFTHYRDDLHQDHRLISDLTWNSYRDHLILEYEVPKYDGDLGSPNFFVHLDEPTCQKKINLILKFFKTQGNKHWFTKDTFLSIMRLRGIESSSPTKYAEAFYNRKLVLHGGRD